MSKQNGHIVPSSNGHVPHPGGQGAVAQLIAREPGHTRRSIRTIQRAVAAGWLIDKQWLKDLPAFAHDMMTDDSKGDRERLRAAELLGTIHRDAVSAAVNLDKMERLDGGGDTERQTVRIVYEDEPSVRIGQQHGLLEHE